MTVPLIYAHHRFSLLNSKIEEVDPSNSHGPQEFTQVRTLSETDITRVKFLRDKDYLKPLLLLTFETTTDRELISVLVQRLSMSGAVWLGTVGGFIIGLYFIFYVLAKISAGRCFYR